MLPVTFLKPQIVKEQKVISISLINVFEIKFWQAYDNIGYSNNDFNSFEHLLYLYFLSIKSNKIHMD